MSGTRFLLNTPDPVHYFGETRSQRTRYFVGITVGEQQHGREIEGWYEETHGSTRKTVYG